MFGWPPAAAPPVQPAATPNAQQQATPSKFNHPIVRLSTVKTDNFVTNVRYLMSF